MSDPLLDPARLEAIAALSLRDGEVRGLLDDLARRAAEALAMPVGLISIVLDQAQWFAGAHGLSGWLDAVRGTPVEWSFCAHVVREQSALVVEDALGDERFASNSLVEHEGVRCYLGVPLVTGEGHLVGSLCVLGQTERAFTETEQLRLRQLATETMQQLESRISLPHV